MSSSKLDEDISSDELIPSVVEQLWLSKDNKYSGVGELELQRQKKELGLKLQREMEKGDESF
jgi:hypothetical protein